MTPPGRERSLAGTWPEERKLVSILFADLTGYTRLASSLDPEEVYRFLRPTVRHLQGIVEDFGGTVPQIMGDGFMAIFGVPVAHEDDAERAVRAALAVRDHVTTLNEGREGLLFPPVHAGVNSGEVMVAPADEFAGFTVVGDTVNIASRLADLASGGHVLVDAWTRDRTAHAISFGPLRARRAKGKAEPLATYEALEPKGARPVQRAPRTSVAFLDREEALARLSAEVAAVDRGNRSRVLLVTGDAGVGKSRLAGELHRRLRGTSVFAGRCAAFGDRLPLAALAEAVAGAAGIGPGASREAILDAAARLADRVATADEAPSVATDLQLLLGAESIRDEPSGSIASMIRGARSALEGLARAEPATVLLDDLHWGDPDLIDLLRQVVSTPWDAPILFLGFARPDAAIDGVPRLELDVLPDDAMVALAREILGGAVPKPVLATWLTRAAGNPLFLGEGLGMLVESGALVPDEDGWRVVDPHRVAQVPATIRLLIAARLDGLPPDEKRLLQDASVAGEQVWDHLLERLTSVAMWRPTLRALEARGLLVRTMPSRIPSAAEYAFEHVLIREVAYEGIPKADRVERHLTVAGWLRDLAPQMDQEPVAALAYHYEQAWRLGRSKTGAGLAPEAAGLAARYLARWAESTFRYEARSAEAIFRRALGAAREAGRGIEPEVVGRLLVGMAETLIELGRHEEALAATVEARRVAARTDDDRLLGRALVAEARIHNDLGRPTRARSRLRRALELFEAAGDLVGQGWALHRLSETYSFTDYREEIELLRRAHGLMARGGDSHGRSVVAQDLAYLLTVFGGREFHRWYGVAERSTVHDADTRSRASLLRTRGYFVYYQGRYAEAVRVMREARPVTVECGDRYAEADTLLIDAMGSSAIAAPELAAATAEEAIRLGREVGSLRIRALGGLVRARASMRSGEPARAARQLAGARKLLAQVPTRPDLIEITLIEAWMHLDRGAWSAAIASAEEYTAAARRLGWRMWEPQGPLVVGRAHLGAGRFEAAADELATAATLARRCDAVGVLDLAVALRTQSKLLDGRQVAGGTNDADDVLLGPVLRESDGLRFLAAEAWDQAADAFAAAVAGWRPLGLTVWLARGLALHATALRRGGRGRQAAVALRSGEEILASLRTPMRERARILSPVGP